MNNNEEINIFKNINDEEELIVRNKELIPEYEREYKNDEIYIEDLEEDFLSELNINKQNNKFLQEQISEKVKKIIDIKNEGLELSKRDSNYSYILDNYINKLFISELLVPVVSDNKKIYNDLDLDSMNEDINNTEKNVGNLTNELENINKINEKFEIGNISYEKFLQYYNQIISPYKNNNKDGGTNLKMNTNIISLNNFEMRIGYGPTFLYADQIDESTKKIKGTYKKSIINGENIKIVGFLLRPEINITTNSFQKVGIIEGLEKSKTNTIIQLKNHCLENNDYIYITNNKILNGYYQIKIIDNNKFTIEFNSEKLDDNIFGTIYSYIKLKYNKIYIKKDGKINGKINYKENNLFLFESNFEKDYIKLLKIIIPNINSIIKFKEKILENVKFMDEINDIISQYMMNINNIHIKDFIKLKKIINNNIIDEEKKIKKIEINWKKIDQSIKSEKDFPGSIYENKFFYDKIIIDLYGIYPLQNTIHDSINNRLIWLNNKIDIGEYYYNFVLSKQPIKSVEETIKIIENTYTKLYNEYEKEKKIDQYFNKCNIPYKKLFDSFDNLNEDKGIYNNGDTVLVKNDGLIYQREDNKWKLLRKMNYNNTILYLCSIGDIDIKKINEINCIYTVDGCKSKRTYKYEKRLKLLENSISNYKELLINKKDNYEQRMKEASIKLKGINKIFINDDIFIPNIIDKIPKNITKLLNMITKIDDVTVKNKLMYSLLDKDGITINNQIYSKKYGGYMMCGHYSYLRQEDYSNDNETKKIIHEQLLTKFSEGEKNGEYVCKMCGVYLDQGEFDDSQGFDEDGNPIRTMEKWTDDFKISKKEDEKIVCKSNDLKFILTTRGFDNDQTTLGINICTIIDSICSKIGITLIRNDYIDIIIDIIEQITQLLSYKVFKKKNILAYRNKKMDEKKILELDNEGVFKEIYNKYYISRKYGIIGSRLLISLQTAVPSYKKKKSLTKCSFSKWDSRFGVEYIACVMTETNMVKYKDRTDKERLIPINQMIDEIFDGLRVYNTKSIIRKKYSEKLFYERKEKNRLEKYKIEITSYKPNEIDELGNNFVSYIIKNNGNKEIYDKLYSRSQYVNYLIKKTVDNIDRKTIILSTEQIENSCCSYNLENSYDIFNDKSINDYLKKLKEESYVLDKYYSYFINKGSITKLFIKGKNVVFTNNSAYIILNQMIMNLKFKKFCYEGFTTGEYHYFIDENCIKCNKNLKDIENKNFSEEEFNNLLNAIMKKFINNLDDNIKITKREIKKEKIYDVDGIITNFMNKLVKILNRTTDKEFINKYTFFIKNLGEYNNLYEVSKEKDVKKFIKLSDNKDEMRLNMVKKYINQYFRKYISIITTGYYLKDKIIKIPYVDSNISKELQKFIYNDTEFLQDFYTEQNKELFSKLKFEYSISDINSITGNSDRYNHTWEKVVKKSDFSLKNAYDILIYILFSELTKFLDITNNPKLIATFIIKIFDMIIENDKITNNSNESVQKYKNEVYYQEYCKFDKLLSTKMSVAEKDFFQRQLQSEIINVEDLMEQEQNDTLAETEEILQDTEIETLARAELGDNVTENDIETYKERYIKEKIQTKKLEKEFNMDETIDIEGDLLEVGDDYGEMEQGGIEE